MFRMLQGVILIVGGAGLGYWGYNMSQSLSSQLNEAFTGAPADKAMYLMIGGGVIAFYGVTKVFRASR